MDQTTTESFSKHITDLIIKFLLVSHHYTAVLYMLQVHKGNTD